jgi:hypothetical protein
MKRIYQRCVIVFLSIGVLTMLTLTCSCQQPSEQRKWHDTIMIGHNKVMDGLVAHKIINSHELLLITGNPDLQTTPRLLCDVLLNRFPEDMKDQFSIEHRNKFCNGIWGVYCRAKADLAGRDFSDCFNNIGKDDKEFLDSTLWLFDESKHFDRPMRWGWNKDFGYQCYIFSLDGDSIITADGFAFWPPIDFNSLFK